MVMTERRRIVSFIPARILLISCAHSSDWRLWVEINSLAWRDSAASSSWKTKKQTKNIKMHVWKAKFYSSNTIYEITQICCSASHLTFAIVVNIDFTSPMSCWWATIMVFTELACDLIESLWNMTEKWHHKLLLVTKRVFARESVKMFGTFFVMINCLQVKEHRAVMFSRGSQKLGKTSPKLKRK